ncbi:MAG: hypothetical protein AAGH83_01425, partial [Pseudomonadota bacterium]
MIAIDVLHRIKVLIGDETTIEDRYDPWVTQSTNELHFTLESTFRHITALQEGAFTGSDRFQGD